jgi:hypothetical protein
MPEGFPLERCYRFRSRTALAAPTRTKRTSTCWRRSGSLLDPLIPVSIRKEYDGFSWTKLPTIGKVSVTVGKTRHTAGVWSGTLTCVDELAITVATSDGRDVLIPSVHGQSAASRRRAAVG